MMGTAANCRENSGREKGAIGARGKEIEGQERIYVYRAGKTCTLNST